MLYIPYIPHTCHIYVCMCIYVNKKLGLVNLSNVGKRSLEGRSFRLQSARWKKLGSILSGHTVAFQFYFNK